MTGNDARPVAVLVIGSGYRHFREYVLRGLAAHHRVVLIAPTIDWQQEYLSDHRAVDLGDDAAVHAAARSLADRYRITGIVTWEETQVERAAEVGRRLDVPTMPCQAARACRDKARQRERFAAAGVPSARYRLVATAGEAVAAAAVLGYPVVVKPRARAASVGVQIVHDDEQLRSAIDVVRATENATITDGMMLVEEFLDGPEISVDSWVLDGRVECYAVAVKRTGFAPYFEEVAHIVGDVVDDATYSAACDVAARAVTALGVDRTVTHTELKLTADGPKVVEVNGRLGGDLIPRLAEISIPNLSVGDMLGAVASGREPAGVDRPAQLVGIRFLYPPADLVFDDIEVPDSLAGQPWVHEVRRVTESGTALRLPPRQFLGRAGYVIATGTDIDQIDARLTAVADGVVVAGALLTD